MVILSTTTFQLRYRRAQFRQGSRSLSYLPAERCRALSPLTIKPTAGELIQPDISAMVMRLIRLLQLRLCKCKCHLVQPSNKYLPPFTTLVWSLRIARRIAGGRVVTDD